MKSSIRNTGSSDEKAPPKRLTEKFLERVAQKSGWSLNQVESLSLQREGIVSLGSSFAGCTSLVHLNLSRNQISTLKGIEAAVSLEELLLFFNKIADLNEIQHLQKLEHLRILDLRLNPVTTQEGYRSALLSQLPNIERLDDHDVFQCSLNFTEQSSISNSSCSVLSKRRLDDDRSTAVSLVEAQAQSSLNFTDDSCTSDESSLALLKTGMEDEAVSALAQFEAKIQEMEAFAETTTSDIEEMSHQIGEEYQPQQTSDSLFPYLDKSATPEKGFAMHPIPELAANSASSGQILQPLKEGSNTPRNDTENHAANLEDTSKLKQAISEESNSLSTKECQYLHNDQPCSQKPKYLEQGNYPEDCMLHSTLGTQPKEKEENNPRLQELMEGIIQDNRAIKKGFSKILKNQEELSAKVKDVVSSVTSVISMMKQSHEALMMSNEALLFQINDVKTRYRNDAFRWKNNFDSLKRHYEDYVQNNQCDCCKGCEQMISDKQTNETEFAINESISTPPKINSISEISCQTETKK